MTRIKTIIAAAALATAALLSAPQAKAANGDYCREYTRTVFIGGRTEQAYGVACLEPDGAWRVADENVNNNRGYDNVQTQNVTYVINDGPRRIYQPRIRYVNYDYYRPARAYYPAPVFGFYVSNNRGWDRHDRHDRRDRHDRWDRRDNGRGHH
jgi:hypothetical protein